MQPRLLTLPIALLFACLTLSASAESDTQEQRIGAAFVITLGREPSEAEQARWKQAGKLSVSELADRLRQTLQRDPEARRQVATKAWADAFGQLPQGQPGSPAETAGYFDLVQRHVRELAQAGADYEQVINRAYQLLLRRPAYDIELTYWKERDTLPFVLLVGAIEGWARRNAPGLMATTGTPAISINSDFLTTVRLSPTVADEARLAAGMRPVRDPNVTFSAARNIVAPGAEDVVSVGWIHFVAAGGPRMTPARAEG